MMITIYYIDVLLNSVGQIDTMLTIMHKRIVVKVPMRSVADESRNVCCNSAASACWLVRQRASVPPARPAVRSKERGCWATTPPWPVGLPLRSIRWARSGRAEVGGVGVAMMLINLPG